MMSMLNTLWLTYFDELGSTGTGGSLADVKQKVNSFSSTNLLTVADKVVLVNPF